MKDRGLGRLFRPTYRDKKTGKKKRSRVLWIELWHHGNPVRFSSRTTNPKQAERVRKQRLAELVTGQFLGSAAERLTFELPRCCWMTIGSTVESRFDERKPQSSAWGKASHSHEPWRSRPIASPVHQDPARGQGEAGDRSEGAGGA